MRYGAALVTLVVAELAVTALAAALYWGARGRLLGAYESAGMLVPAATQLSLSSWFLPVTSVVGLAAAALALLPPMRRSRRMTLLATGLTVSAFATMFAALAAFVPLLGG